MESYFMLVVFDGILRQSLPHGQGSVTQIIVGDVASTGRTALEQSFKSLFKLCLLRENSRLFLLSQLWGQVDRKKDVSLQYVLVLLIFKAKSYKTG